MLRTVILGSLRRISPSTTFPSPRCFLKTVSDKFKHGDRIALNVIVPPGKKRLVKCQTTNELQDFVKVYKGTLRIVNTDEVILPTLYSDVSPFMTYEIESPFFESMKDERHHRQISDKAFEQKSYEAMIRYFDDHKISFHELNRIIKVAREIVAEWEGVFELEDGQVWLLESKHCVTAEVIVEQLDRLEKSMMALGKDVSCGTAFLAGHYWEARKETAQKLGFGILFENGDDLTVVYKGAS